MNDASMLTEILPTEIPTEDLDVVRIICDLGGLRNVIQHCLNDSAYCSKNIAQENTKSLEELLLDSDSKSKYHLNHNNKYNQSQPIPMSEFKTHQITFTVNQQNNLYFKCLGKRKESFIQNTILFNQWFNGCAIILYLIIFCIVYYLDVSNNGCKNTCNFIKVLLHSVLIIHAIFICMAGNIDLVKAIFDSFDFWFKLYNLVILTVASIINVDVLSSDDLTVARVLTHISVMFGVCTAFLLDSVKVCLSTKIFVLIFVTTILLLSLFDIWIAIDENKTQWNPFKSYIDDDENSDVYLFTTLNFKSIQMAALSNLIIFSTKPMFTALRYKMKDICKRQRLRKNSTFNQNNNNSNNNNHNNNQNSDQYCTRSTSVYKKPYFQWGNGTVIASQSPPQPPQSPQPPQPPMIDQSMFAC